MKMIIVATLALVAAVAAIPVDNLKEIPIVRSEYVKDPQGGYTYNSETGDGIVKSETGELKEVIGEDNKPHLVLVVRGQYSYTDPDGNVQTITYTGDEEGFKAEGPSIPRAPEAVARR